MSSLYKDSRSRYWVCCYTAADGRQLKRSTRLTDKTEARLVCHAWEDAEALGRKGYLTSEEQCRRVLTETLQRISGRKLYDPTVSQWLERWLSTEQGAIDPNTHRKYSQIVKDFLSFLGSRSELRLEVLATDDFIAWRDCLLERGLAPQTVNINLRKILKRAFELAANEGLIDRNPITAVRPLRGVKAEKGIFLPQQVVRLLDVAKGDWRGMILAGYYTGGRLNDLALLKWGAIDLVERSVTFRQKKTDLKIKIPLHGELLDYLLSRSAPDDDSAPLFPTLYDQAGAGRSTLSKAFIRLMKAARIDQGTARARSGTGGQRVSRLSFHSMRHSFTSALANAGVGPELRKKLSGHLDDESHSIYTHHEFETIREALEKLGRLPKEGGPQ
jgi:integrase